MLELPPLQLLLNHQKSYSNNRPRYQRDDQKNSSGSRIWYTEDATVCDHGSQVENDDQDVGDELLLIIQPVRNQVHDQHRKKSR